MIGLFVDKAERGLIVIVVQARPALSGIRRTAGWAEEFALLDRKGADRKPDGSALLQKQERFQQSDGILAAGQSDGDPVALADHLEALDCLADFP